MKFIRQLNIGISAYFDAISFVRRNHLFHLLLLPAIFNLIAFICTAWLAWLYSADVVQFLWNQTTLSEPTTFLLRLLQKVIFFMIRLIMLLLYFKLFRYIILIFFAPVLSYLTGKIMDIVTGQEVPFSFEQLIHDALRGATIALRNFFLEIMVTISIIVMGFVFTVFSPLVPLLIFLVESYFYGFSMIDYRNEYAGLGYKASNKFIWKHKGIAVANGMVFNFSLLIPVIGVLFVPPLALTAAILSVHSITLKEK